MEDCGGKKKKKLDAQRRQRPSLEFSVGSIFSCFFFCPPVCAWEEDRRARLFPAARSERALSRFASELALCSAERRLDRELQ